MEKVIKDNSVAVCYSPGYGAGWSTWCSNREMCETLIFHPKIIQMVESGQKITRDWLVNNFGQEYDEVYIGDQDLAIKYVPVGCQFDIDEHDGYESVIIITSKQYYIA